LEKRGRDHISATRTVYGVALQKRIPRLALKPGEAAQALGWSLDFFDEHIGPVLRWVRRGRLKFVAIAELEDWLRRSAVLNLEGHR
jgi:hypothetical protein